jgi:3-oxoacyl-[acyl-carrier protein] reductase
MELTYKHKTALVTGAGRGIGKEIAKLLASEGLTVICVSRTEQTCAETAAEIKAAGGQAHAVAVDVSDREAVYKAAEQLLTAFDSVDILVNNAGITRDNLMLRMSDAEWDDVITTNLSSCFYWTKALLRPMTRNRWGRIINMASVVGLMGNAGQANYAAAKAGMLGFTKALARELASRNITSNAVAPGFIKSDMTDALGEDIANFVKQAVPLKRIGEASEVAHMVAYLASDQAAYITGQVFTVDGGMVM